MPTYDYKCRGCGHTFDELQSFSDPPLTKCPACKKNRLERLFGGGGAIIFKGSGFYETDYRRAGTNGQANGKPETEAAPAEGKTEAKAEAKTEAKTESAAPAKDSAAPTSSTTKSEKSGGTKKAK
jgi:putative FmdB family regulatory protein